MNLIAINGIRQLAETTSDIVSSAESGVTLIDGRTPKTIIPRVYLTSHEGDMAVSGSL